MSDWISFFDSDHPIYVSERHRRVHADLVASGIERYLATPVRDMLDYGCGEAIYAERIAARVKRLFLCEAAPHLRDKLAGRFAGDASVSAISPEDAAALPGASFDLIVMHSVTQYLTPDKLDELLALFRRLLRQDGLLVLGDIVRPDVSVLTDAFALLKLAARNRFLLAAARGLVRTALSDYRKLRMNMGLTRYREADMLRKMEAAGFAAKRAQSNIGHNQARMTFEATPAA